VAAGPGLWEDWPDGLPREGLIGQLQAGGAIARAVAEAKHGHRLDHTLTAEVTALCVVTGALFTTAILASRGTRQADAAPPAGPPPSGRPGTPKKPPTP
jgi:hypothetical protein